VARDGGTRPTVVVVYRLLFVVPHSDRIQCISSAFSHKIRGSDGTLKGERGYPLARQTTKCRAPSGALVYEGKKLPTRRKKLFDGRSFTPASHLRREAHYRPGNETFSPRPPNVARQPQTVALMSFRCFKAAANHAAPGGHDESRPARSYSPLGMPLG